MRDDGVLAEPMSLQVLPSNDFTGPSPMGKTGCLEDTHGGWEAPKR